MKRRRGQSLEGGPLTALERGVVEYQEWLLVRGYTEATARSKGKRLRRLAGWLAERGVTSPEGVSRPALERFQRWLYHYRKADGAPLSFSNQHGVLVAAQGFFRWLVKSGRLPSNPASELELPKLERRLPKAVLTAAEAEAVLAGVFESQGSGAWGQGSAKDRGESSADPWTLSPEPLFWPLSPSA
jgi:site-specific recombinase XerD